jgi:hypothetical protein
MATLREYFDTDFTRLLNSAQLVRWRSDGVEGDAPVRVHFDFDSNVKFVSCYLPAAACRADVIEAVLNGVGEWITIGDGLEVQTGFPGERRRTSRDLRFSGRLFIYHESEVDDALQTAVRARALAQGVDVQFRGPQFADGRAGFERPLAFISHDSRDKDAIARPIAVGLAGLMCPVWFDEFSLRVGDRLRESIERGLREARKCILVITPHFIANRGWTREEFSAIFTRELVERADVILPVWHEVTRDQVFEFSAVLADRVAVNWNLGPQEAVRLLKRAIGD